MTKPTIIKRLTKGSALTYAEQDTNFQNLADATIGITDGTNSGALNLNDTLTFTAGSNITLSYNSSTKALTITSSVNLANPPSIGSSTPNSGAFTTLTASTSISGPLKNYYEPIYALSYSSTLTPDISNGNIQKVTLTGNVTINALANVASGQSITLILVQDSTGSRTLTSTMKFANGIKSLTTAANSIDVLHIFYDGTNYMASLVKGYS